MHCRIAVGLNYASSSSIRRRQGRFRIPVMEEAKELGSLPRILVAVSMVVVSEVISSYSGTASVLPGPGSPPCIGILQGHASPVPAPWHTCHTRGFINYPHWMRVTNLRGIYSTLHHDSL